MKIDHLSEFSKDLKFLKKRFRSLDEDLIEVKLILSKKPAERPPFSYRINDLGIETCIIKVKKIACRSMKGKGVNTGLRLVYAYFPEKSNIILIELYHKSDKAIEDRERILKHYKK